MDLPVESFDLVVAIHVIEHLSDPRLVLNRCLQALRPGVIFYSVTPNGASASLRLFKDAWWLLEDPTHLRFFSPRSVINLLGKAGFRDVQTKAAWWDSVGVEANSIRRKVAMHRLGLLAGLIPIAMMCRLAHRNLTPCMEAVAHKEPTSRHR